MSSLPKIAFRKQVVKQVNPRDPGLFWVKNSAHFEGGGVIEYFETVRVSDDDIVHVLEDETSQTWSCRGLYEDVVEDLTQKDVQHLTHTGYRQVVLRAEMAREELSGTRLAT